MYLLYFLKYYLSYVKKKIIIPIWGTNQYNIIQYLHLNSLKTDMNVKEGLIFMLK